MKIKEVKNPEVFVALRRVCHYLVNNVWKSHLLGTGEIESEFNLAKEKSKRHEKDIIQLSKIDTELNWGETKKYKNDKQWVVSKTGDFNPWYNGNLELEELLKSIESIYEFLDSGDNYIQDAEFIHYFNFLSSIAQQKNGEKKLFYKYEDDHQNYGSETPPVVLKNPPFIKLKTLELIAKEIGYLGTDAKLKDFLIECGVDKRLIVYPQTKWRMVEAVLVELACSKNPEDKKVLFKIIGDAIHPIMHEGNTLSAGILVDKFKDLLSYENLSVSYDEKDKVYKVTEPLSEEEINEIMSELDEEGKKQLKFLCQPENRERISLLRKTYQALMGVVEVFCRNLSLLPIEETAELNKYYLELDKAAWGIIDELRPSELFKNYRKYPRPFTNLFSAEKEHDGKISWDVIRREMSARFGEIETLYQQVNASDILAEPDKQKRLNGVTLYLSELKEKTKIIEQKAEASQPPATRIEITNMPELEIKGLKEIAKVKKGDDKPKFPYKLPAGTRWEEIAIKFSNDENVFIQAKRFKHYPSYKEMGFVGKGNIPNPSEAWTFLRVLAGLNGELTIRDPKAKDKYKKQKELLAKALQSYFSIDYDPFYPYINSLEKTGNSYKMKITLIPPPNQDKLDGQNSQVYNE